MTMELDGLDWPLTGHIKVFPAVALGAHLIDTVQERDVTVRKEHGNAEDLRKSPNVDRAKWQAGTGVCAQL